jgi:glycosyltransferase involved in cell wall biosynthesis
MHIALIAKPGHLDTGVGRYARELKRALEALGHQVTVVHPLVPLPAWLLRAFRRWPGWDLEAFFFNYPIWTRYPQANVYHFTSQNLATLLLLRLPNDHVVVTVHDIIPHMTRDDPETSYKHIFDRLFDTLAIWGLKRCPVLISVSHYTKRTLVEKLGISAERIFVTHEGVIPFVSDDLVLSD